MASRDRSDIHNALKSKGFNHNAGSKHDIFVLEFEGKKTQISTFTSRGSNYKSYEGNLLEKMRAQLKLSMNEFLELIDCPLSYDAYIKKLKAKKLL